MKKLLLSILITHLSMALANAQTITFDNQSYTGGQTLVNPYTISNNGETFLFTLSGGVATNHIYRTSEPSCSSTGISHVYAGNTSQTTWTIETQSGNEIDLASIRFDNVFSCFSFNYSLTIEGFKNNVSTGTQVFSVTGLNNVFTSNTSLNDVDKVAITASDIAHLGIDDISWLASTLSIEENIVSKKINISPNPTTNFINISGLRKTETYTIYNLLGQFVKKGTVVNNAKINVENLVNGVYFFKINNSKVAKFVKQ